MAKKSKSEKWIAGAVKHPGALKAKANSAGMSTRGYANAHKDDKGATGRQSRLAITLGKMKRK